MSMHFGKASNRRLTLAAVPRESGAADRLLDNSRQMVRLDLIDDNPRNPRRRVDEESARELAASIAEHGLLQAPVVRRHPDDPDRYMVVLGSRRVAAHRLLGRDEIEVIVRRLEDGQAFIASCVENVQRVELSPREEMDMIGVLIDELGSQEAAARALGKSPTWLSKRKRVLAVPALAAAVERGEISLDHAYDLATRAPDEAAMLAQLARVRAGGQSQGATRDALAPRPRPAPGVVGEPPRVSDRNFAVGGGTPPAPSPTSAPDADDAAGTPDRGPRQGARSAAGGDEISDRNFPDREAAPTTTRPIPATAASPQATPHASISDRNRGASAGAAPNGYDAADLIELGELAIVRLVRAVDGRASREALVRALRADLAALEGR
jgi:ParB/RepB/Spo0J family partition protein